MTAKYLVDLNAGFWACDAQLPVGMGLFEAPGQALRQITGVTV